MTGLIPATEHSPSRRIRWRAGDRPPALWGIREDPDFAGPVVRPPAVLIGSVLIVALVAVWWHGPLLDLHIYRLGGLSVRLGGADLYSLRDSRTGLPFTYPPFAAFVFAPLAAISEPAATVLITVLTVAATVRLAGLIAGEFDLPPVRQGRLAGGLLVAMALSEPLISTMLYGQINMVLFTLAAQAWLRPRSRWALVGLGVAAGLKLTPAVFILGLVCCGRWRDGLRAAVTAEITVVIGAVYLGRPTLTFFGGAGFSDTRIGGTAYISNQSLNGLLWRLGGPGGVRPVWLGLSLLVLVAALWSARVISGRGQTLLALGLVALAGLLVSPVSWSHHWVGAVLIAAALLRPATGRTHRWPLLGMCWLVVPSSWLIWFVPHGGDVEYHSSIGRILVGNAYLELALVTVVSLTLHAWRRRVEVPG